MKDPICWAERGFLPDWLVRLGIRRLLGARLQAEVPGNASSRIELLQERIEKLKGSPVAILTEKANEQHYEVPSALYETFLGKRLKYSSCLWSEETNSLDEAEEAMLQLTCERAGIEDGMRILELGCGWGSLSLWIAETYKDCTITAISNSRSQAEYIEGVCDENDIRNLRVMTCNMNDLEISEKYDRIVSIEMFEHLRNYEIMLHRIARWLVPEGRLFVHIFCHREMLYFFEDVSDADWMSRHFFSGGIMPSSDIFHHFQRDMILEKQWIVNGNHYSRTLEAWLSRLDRNRDTVKAICAEHYGAREAEIWVNRWRIFLMACSELFRYNKGEEWWVSHYLLHPRSI